MSAPIQYNLRTSFKKEAEEQCKKLQSEHYLEEGKYYAEKFLKALLHHSELDFTKQWEYIGGNEGRHLNVFHDKVRKTEALPEVAHQCICTHDIVENCYIRNVITGQILVVGNCCIQRFLKIDTSKKCSRCSAPHKNRKDNFCQDCRGGVFHCTEFNGQTFRHVFLHHPAFVQEVLDTTKIVDSPDILNFKAFIIANMNELPTSKCTICQATHSVQGENFCGTCRGDVFTIGQKHKGRSFRYVFMNDPSYINWIRGLNQAKLHKEFVKFIAFVNKNT